MLVTLCLSHSGQAEPIATSEYPLLPWKSDGCRPLPRHCTGAPAGCQHGPGVELWPRMDLLCDLGAIAVLPPNLCWAPRNYDLRGHGGELGSGVRRLGLEICTNGFTSLSLCPHPHPGDTADSTPPRWEDSVSMSLHRAWPRVGASGSCIVKVNMSHELSTQ